MKAKLGQKLDRFSVRTTRGRTLAVPDQTHRYTHLQFRRFAGCPICNFHLHTFVNSIEKLHAASIREVVVFHSSLREMVKHQDQLPFDTVADPTKALYKEYGVETSITAPLHPRAMAASIKGIALGKMGLKMENGPLGLPADILIDDRGVVVAVKYGTHAYDQWEVEEILRLAANADLVRLRRLAEA